MDEATMTASSPPLRVLSDEECVSLLTRHRFGRLALGLEGWPAILPVNYMFEESSIVIRTAPGAKLEEGPLTTVAFEIDGADRFGYWGWSVLAQGPLFDITTSLDQLSEHLRTLPVRPWVPGAHDHWLKLTPARLSGRAFGEIDLDE
jgi:nitroimidazol reductase NimA-like FMN-containing flavoprotein (pyridoxamine 5'-phosphate oxidase superfamily)